ncbi:S-layer homology domain-containing protein [Paenibacillus sp. PL2-23]|uniref:S-layer homology domain-containing protein n=1 Tax=Paenibacillus sp. PL2-23 TaxID=2100729 RepID=UPI0030F6377E
MAFMKRNGLLLVSALLLLSLWSPGSLLAAQEPMITLKATNGEAKVMLEVKGRGLADLYAFQFNLAYDPKKLRFLSAKSAIPGFTVEPIVTNGDILFAHSKVGSAKGTSGEATLATLTFEMLSAGPSIFTLYDVKLVDSGLDMLELSSRIQWTSLAFRDIAGHWAEASIGEAGARGWVAGYSDGTFRPSQPVTRAEFVAMLVRALDVPIPASPVLSFRDKESIPDWATAYIAAAIEAKLIEGYSDGTFQPGRLISRAEMASLIVRAEGIVPTPGEKPRFADADEIPVWAQPYIAAAVNRGWIQGVGNGRFAPLNNANRAAAVHLIVTLLEER